MKKSTKPMVVVTNNETPAPTPPSLAREYGDFDVFMKRLRALDRRLARVCEFGGEIDNALDNDAKPTEATLNKFYAEQKELARQNSHLLKEIAWVAAEREFYDAEELYDKKDGNWRLKKRVIDEQVAILIGSFPNAGPHNPQVYTGMLTNEIAATEPNAMSLEAACREVRRTKTFPPTIAEVLKILEQKQDEIYELSEADNLENWKDWNKDIAGKLADLRGKVGLPPE